MAANRDRLPSLYSTPHRRRKPLRSSQGHCGGRYYSGRATEFFLEPFFRIGRLHLLRRVFKHCYQEQILIIHNT